MCLRATRMILFWGLETLQAERCLSNQCFADKLNDTRTTTCLEISGIVLQLKWQPMDQGAQYIGRMFPLPHILTQ